MSGSREADPVVAADDRPDEDTSPLQRLYGAHLWHLLVLLALLAATAYVVSLLLGRPELFRLGVWFLGCAVAWDLALGPALAAVDAVLRRTVGRMGAPGVQPLNHVRVPALLSGTLLLVFAPLVLRRSEGVYAAKAGLHEGPFLGRWLVVTVVLFAASALWLAVDVLRARRR